MSSETIVTALFLIGAIVAAGVLLNSVFPVISQTGQSFGSVAHESDVRMRSDFSIVNIFAKNSDSTLQVWMKNVGTNRLSLQELYMSDVFLSDSANVQRASLRNSIVIEDDSANSWWDPGETAKITTTTLTIPAKDTPISVSVVLLNGVRRSADSTVY